MNKHRIFTTSFASVYPHYVQKAAKKGRTRQEVDQIICWLTGYSPEALAEQIERKKDFEAFFSEAPALHHPTTTLSKFPAARLTWFPPHVAPHAVRCPRLTSSRTPYASRLTSLGMPGG